MNISKTFAKYFPVTKGNKAKPYIILFDAMIGYGKSYVARKIAAADGSVVISNNEVRYRLGDFADQYAEQWHELQHQRIKNLLAAGNSLIIDECLPINYQKKLDFYKGLGALVYIVRLDCDKNVWAERVRARRFDPPREYSVINYDDAVAINAQHPDHVPNELVDFTIDTTDSEEIDSQVDEMLADLQSKL